MTREEFLLNTIKYYSEDTLRRCEEDGKCRYSGKTLNKNSDGCAIGRWLDEEVKLDLDSLGPVPVQNEKVFDKLPKWMQGMGIYFLQHVQELHDSSIYWDESGLSQLGKNKVNEMIEHYYFNIPKYK